MGYFLEWAQKHFKAGPRIVGPWTRFWQRAALLMFAVSAMLLAWLLGSCCVVIEAAFHHGDTDTIQRATRAVLYPVYALVPMFCGVIFAEIMVGLTFYFERRADRSKE